jgi:dynein light chain LC8-type
MQQEAVEVATEAMEKYHIEKDIAQYIKREVRSIRPRCHGSID